MSANLLSEPNILNVSIQDDFTKKISDFIYQHCQGPNIEVEAKLGVLLSKTTQHRISLPVLSETILSQIQDLKFESAIPAECFQQLNKLLNQRAQDSPARVAYSHTREIDKFYDIPQYGKVRVTYLNDDIKGCLQKRRIADLNVYCPDSVFDFRLSINVETPVPKEDISQYLIPSNIGYMRSKDRLSYSHDVFRIDLTRVGEKNSAYEVEIEIANMVALMDEREKASKQSTNQFSQIVKAFIANVRLLAQRAHIRDGRLLSRII